MDPPANKGRPPLTNVSNNVVQRVPKPSQTPCHDLPNDPRKCIINAVDEAFFLYRRYEPTPTAPNHDLFNLLSDEILLHIFRWLPKKTLLRCGEVSRRFYQVSRDETLWYRLDLSGRNMRYNSTVDVLNRGVVVLRMAQTIISPHPGGPCSELLPRVKLQYLDLSMCTVEKPTLRALLASCRSLLKLSLEHVPLDESICAEIAENRRLETLNLTMCSGIEATGMLTMVQSLTKLHSVNFGWTNLSAEAVHELVNQLTSHVVHLNIAGCRSTMTDDSLAILLKRCTKLVALDLSDCSLLTSAAIPLLCKARKLEYLSLSRCYNIAITAYLNFTQLRALRYLDVFGLLSEPALETLKESLGDVEINRYYHSSVARPTVGTKRTSIWGLRTRD